MADSVSLSGTTLPDDGTLIETQVPPYYHRLGLDSYETVISKYGVTVDEENPWKALLGIPIDPVHLRPLVETIGFLYNKCHLHEASQIRSKSKRQFECGTCQLFAIVFRRNKNDGTKAPYTMKVEPPSHHQTCPATNIVPSHHVLENMTEFTDFVYSRL
jgi:hypothetical protein